MLQKQRRTTIGSFIGATKAADEAIESQYWIGRLLNRLELNANVEVWEAMDEIVTDASLKKLSTSLEAKYHSAESIGLRRGGCTTNTRTQVMDDLYNWGAMKLGIIFKIPISRHYSLDGAYIISSSFDMFIRIWDVHTGKVVGQLPEGHTSTVISVVLSPNGARIASLLGKKIRTWDSYTGKLVRRPLEGHTNKTMSYAYSPDGEYIVSSSRN